MILVWFRAELNIQGPVTELARTQNNGNKHKHAAKNKQTDKVIAKSIISSEIKHKLIRILIIVQFILECLSTTWVYRIQTLKSIINARKYKDIREKIARIIQRKFFLQRNPTPI
jgi:hypothetical protein